jgi:DsbE subfamily thiol:disulfide oxidoreductase
MSMNSDASSKNEWFATRRSLIVGAIGMAGLGAGAAVVEHVWTKKDMAARFLNPFAIDGFDLPPVPGLMNAVGAPMPGLSSVDLADKRSLLVVWASWCPTCREEHKHIVALAKRNLAPIYGADVKDAPAKARLFLAKHGNPFAAVGMDEHTYLQRALGAKGVPATFVVGPGPVIEWSTYGGLDPETIEREIVPRLTAKAE